MANQMKVSELNEAPVIGAIYSFINEFNYVTIYKVVKVTEYSVMVKRPLNDGGFTNYTFRVGARDFSKYTKQN